MLTRRIASSACPLGHVLPAAVGATRIARGGVSAAIGPRWNTQRRCGVLSLGLRRRTAAAAGAFLLALVVTSPAIGAPDVDAGTTLVMSAVARPDRKVTGGTVRASSGRLSGSFTV